MAETKNMKPIGARGFCCAHCGKSLVPTDIVLVCADCGAIFCEDCVKDGTAENHECDPDDEEVE